jgi:hypothetical protein
MPARLFFAILVVTPTVALAPVASCGGSTHTSSSEDGSSPDASSDDGSPPGQDAPAEVSREGGLDGGDARGEDGPVCLTDLSDVGAGDFSIHFQLATNETGMTLALLNQRLGCDEMSIFWDVTLSVSGDIVAATDDGIAGHYVTVQATSSLNDGKPHEVDVVRASGKLWITADGAVVSPMTPDPYTFTTFSSLAVGTSACSGVTPAAAYAVIANVCLTEP